MNRDQLPPALTELAAAVAPLNPAAQAAARQRHDQLAKPPGSLGVLEDVGVQLAGIAGRCPPPVPRRPAVLIAAGDHGVHVRGVSPWPQAVSTAMATELLAGRATANALARRVGAAVTVLDVGLVEPLAPSEDLRTARVRAGTRDLVSGPALTVEEAVAAVGAGAAAARDLIDDGHDLLVLGEIGIANTTPSAALIGWASGRPAAAVTGRGAGADAELLARKVAVVDAALVRHRYEHHDDGGDETAAPSGAEPAVAALASLGGLEHAALVGAVLAGAPRVPVVLDGVTTLAAALIAARLAQPVVQRLVAGHRSAEPGASVALRTLGLRPLLDLDLRLGEGTGGLLAVPIVQAAASVLHDVVTLSEVLARR